MCLQWKNLYSFKHEKAENLEHKNYKIATEFHCKYIVVLTLQIYDNLSADFQESIDDFKAGLTTI